MNKKNSPVICVVDDEEDICEIIKFNLEAEGYKVFTALSAEEILEKPLMKYQLFILDIMMKGISGFRLADEIRNKRKLETPIIFLTAKDTENDKLTGFSVGADDYVTKPFSIRELVARVKAILRRQEPDHLLDNSNIKISGIELDQEKKKLFLDNVKISLTPHEYQIMLLLLKNHGKVYTREEILNFAWKEYNYVLERTVDVHITRLRKKIGKYGKYLISRSGHGYCFEME